MSGVSLEPPTASIRVVDEERVAATRSRMITGDEATRVTELFRLLGDPNRVRLLYALAEAGDDAKVLGGGQSLLPVLRLRMNAPTVLVDVSGWYA